MGNDNESSVLATRVLTYLKRKAGKGQPPSEAEAKAAAVALQLLNNRYPGIAADPSKAIENLSKIARKGPPDPSLFGDLSKPENAVKYHDAMISFQQAMSQLQMTYEMMSNLLKTQHDMQMTVVRNLRG